MLPTSKAFRSGAAIQIPHQGIHDQDREGHALGIAAKIADEDGQQAAAHAVDEAAGGRDGGGRVVGGHKDGAEQQAAREDLREHEIQPHVALREEEGQQGHRADVGDGDVPGDDPAQEQVDKAGDEQDGRHLTDAAAGTAEDEVDQRRIRQLALLEGGEGGGGRDDVDAVGGDREVKQAEACLGGGEEAHLLRPGEEEDAGREGGVDEVFADSAEELFDNDDGKGRADGAHPERNGGRQVERQQEACDGGRTVGDGDRAAQELLCQRLSQHGCADADGDDQQHAQTEAVHTPDRRRHEGQQDVDHDRAGGVVVLDVGGGGDGQQGGHFDAALRGDGRFRFHSVSLLFLRISLRRLGAGASGGPLGVDRALGDADKLDDLHLPGAVVGACPALDAGQHAEFLGLGQPAGLGVLRKVVGHQVHGAVFDTAAAVDAGFGQVRALLGLLGEDEDGRGAFGDRCFDVPLGSAHHGSAEDELAGRAAQAAARLDDVEAGGTDGNKQIFRLGDAVAVDGDDALNERHAVGEG